MSLQEQNRMNEAEMTDEQYRGALRALAQAASEAAAEALQSLEQPAGYKTGPSTE